jgi:hypothetical protein
MKSKNHRHKWSEDKKVIVAAILFLLLVVLYLYFVLYILTKGVYVGYRLLFATIAVVCRINFPYPDTNFSLHSFV